MIYSSLVNEMGEYAVTQQIMFQTLKTACRTKRDLDGKKRRTPSIQPVTLVVDPLPVRPRPWDTPLFDRSSKKNASPFDV